MSVKIRVFFLLAILISAAVFPAESYAEIRLEGSWDEEAGKFTLSWSEMTNSSGTVAYILERAPGIGNLDTDSVTLIPGSDRVYEDSEPGTHEYRVTATDEEPRTVVSGIVQNRYLGISETRGNAERFREYDGEGGHLWGYGQIWHIPFSVQDISSVNIEVYRRGDFMEFRDDPGARDSDGYWVSPGEPPGGYDPVKVLRAGWDVPLTPSGETQSVSWDWRDESGVVQPPGTYYVFFEVFDTEEVKRDSGFKTVVIPKPDYRNFEVAPISEDNPVSVLTYQSNTRSASRVLICLPGTEFIPAPDDGSMDYMDYGFTYEYVKGEPLPVNPVTEEVEPGRIIRIMEPGTKPAGDVSLEWDGRTQRQGGVEPGLYRAALTGRSALGELISGEFLVQDIEVEVETTGDEITPKMIFRSSVKAYPQPAETGDVNIAFELYSRSDLTLEIFNLMQNKIYSRRVTDLERGEHIITWNLRDDSGNRVPPGLYFYRLRAISGDEKYQVNKTLVVVR